MAQKLKETIPDADKTEINEKAENKVKIHWDDSRMKSTYANVSHVSSTQEELTLLFGTNQSWHTGQSRLTVQLSDRIILNPFAAKRLSILLNNVVQEYEKRFGTLSIEAGKPTAASLT